MDKTEKMEGGERREKHMKTVTERGRCCNNREHGRCSIPNFEY